MAKAKLYSMEQVEAARKLLRALAATKSGKTKKEVVELLAEDVRKAVKEGHSLKAIQETLGKTNIPVSLARMKVVLGENEDAPTQNAVGTMKEKDTARATKKKPATTHGDGGHKGSA